jgi:GntR family transcriptional regulator of arabinose operon
MSEHKGYREVAAELEDYLQKCGLEPGAILPSERILQEEFGTSRTTLRRALRLLADQGQLVSVPNRGMAIPPLPSQSRIVAMIDGTSRVHKKLFIELEQQLRSRGFHLIHLDGSPEGFQDSLLHAQRSQFAAALVWPSRGFVDEAVMREAASSLPIVCMAHEIRGYEQAFDLIQLDNFEAGRLATEFLIQQGCRNVALTGMIDMLSWSHQRLSGYMKAHFDSGRAPEPRNYAFVATSGHNQADMGPLRWLMEQPDRPDGLMVMQDEYAPEAAELILSLGLSIPDDVALCAIGAEHEVRIGGHTVPAVQADWQAFAKMVSAALFERLEEPLRPAQRRLAGVSFEAEPPKTFSSRTFLGHAATRRSHQ